MASSFYEELQWINRKQKTSLISTRAIHRKCNIHAHRKYFRCSVSLRIKKRYKSEQVPFSHSRLDSNWKPGKTQFRRRCGKTGIFTWTACCHKICHNLIGRQTGDICKIKNIHAFWPIVSTPRHLPCVDIFSQVWMFVKGVNSISRGSATYVSVTLYQRQLIFFFFFLMGKDPLCTVMGSRVGTPKYAFLGILIIFSWLFLRNKRVRKIFDLPLDA